MSIFIDAADAMSTGSLSADDWVPFAYPQDGAIQVYGEVATFRMLGSAGNTLAVGLWRCLQAGMTPVYSSELGDETFLVLEGAATLHILDTGESFHFVTGDVGSWCKGTRTQWDVTAPFKKFYVVADRDPPPHV